MPYLGGRRVDLATWRAANPRRPNIHRDADGNVFRSDEFDDAGDGGFAAGPLTTEEYQRQGRSPRSEAMVRHAIADALGVGQDSPELAEVEAKPIARDVFGRPFRPWDDGSPATPEDALAADLKAAMDEVRALGATDMGDAHSVPAGADAIADANSSPARKRGQATHRARDAAWRESKGIGRPPRKDRPSQTYAGRRARYLRLKAARLGVSVKSVEQTTPKRGPWPKAADQ